MFLSFVFKNVQGILQSIQNLPFRFGSEKYRNDLNQKDKI